MSDTFKLVPDNLHLDLSLDLGIENINSHCRLDLLCFWLKCNVIISHMLQWGARLMVSTVDVCLVTMRCPCWLRAVHVWRLDNQLWMFQIKSDALLFFWLKYIVAVVVRSYFFTTSASQDYSGYGHGQKQDGTTFVFLMILLKYVLVFRPTLFLHENVMRFPLEFIASVLSPIYNVDHHSMDPADLTALPVHRKRRYWICRLATHMVMYRSLATVCEALSFSGRLTLQDLFFSEVPANCPLSELTASLRRSLQKFLSVAEEDDVYDLTQNAFKRRRSCSTKLVTLTKGCSHLWAKSLSRKIWCLVARYQNIHSHQPVTISGINCSFFQVGGINWFNSAAKHLSNFVNSHAACNLRGWRTHASSWISSCNMGSCITQGLSIQHSRATCLSLWCFFFQSLFYEGLLYSLHLLLYVFFSWIWFNTMSIIQVCGSG